METISEVLGKTGQRARSKITHIRNLNKKHLTDIEVLFVFDGTWICGGDSESLVFE